MSKTRCLQLKKEILNGRMLSMDPTSGTKNSEAGWAIFDAGKLESSGIISIADGAKDERLRDILATLQTEFTEVYDVLALEDIPVARRRGNFDVSQTLIQACGVYIAGTSGKLVELNSHTWQAVARRLGGWVKGDESDAQYIGLAAIAFASGYTQKLTEKLKIEFLGNLAEENDYWDLPDMREHWRSE